MSAFFSKGSFCEIKNSKNFDAIVEMVHFLEYFFIFQNYYSFFRIIFGHLFYVYFADPVSTLVVFSILNLFFSVYASHDVYLFFIICISNF